MATRNMSTVAYRKWMWQQKGRWALYEDELLMKLVKRHGPGKWRHIAYHMKGKSGRSCRLRWINQLDPNVDRSPFSKKDSQRIFELHEKYGNRWSIIARHFKGRTDNQVKNQYHILVARKNSKPKRASCIKRGSIGMQTVSVGLQFSDGSMQETNQMMPVFDGGSSSVYGRGETWLGLHWFSGANNIHSYQGISRGDSVMSDANSAAFSEFCPDPEPQQGVETTVYQFIDFMGVGSSE